MKENAEYVLGTTIDTILTIHHKKSQIKSANYQKYFIDLKKTKVPVYKKASKNSELVRNTPEGLTRLDTDYQVHSLDSEGYFNHITYSNVEEKIYFYGFISNEEIIIK